MDAIDDGETTTTVPEVRADEEAEREKRAEAGAMVDAQEKRTEEVEKPMETEEKSSIDPEAVADERADTEDIAADEPVLRTEDQAVAGVDEAVRTEEDKIKEEAGNIKQARSDGSEDHAVTKKENAVEDNARLNAAVQENEEVERPESNTEEEREGRAKQAKTEDAPAAIIHAETETKADPEVQGKTEEVAVEQPAAVATGEDAECPEGKTEDEKIQPTKVEAKTEDAAIAQPAATGDEEALKDAKEGIIQAEVGSC